MIIKVVQNDLVPTKHTGNNEIVTVMMRNISGEARSFRCFNCGHIICQLEGQPAHIRDDGSVPTEKNYLDILCHRCKIIFRFVL